MKQTIIQNFRYILLLICALFVLAALVLGEWLKVYDAVWWWDDMLHGLSGVILGLIGLLGIYFLNARYGMKISPALVAVFVFCFAVTAGVMWEIYEFVVDVIFKTAMQQWNMPSSAIVIGRSYQGMGLRDTMSDLIVASIGGAIAATIAYFAYKNRRVTVLSIMKQTFPKLGGQVAATKRKI